MTIPSPTSGGAKSVEIVTTEQIPESGWHYLTSNLATRHKHGYILLICVCISVILSCIFGVVLFCLLTPAWWYLPFWEAPEELPHSFQVSLRNCGFELGTMNYIYTQYIFIDIDIFIVY